MRCTLAPVLRSFKATLELLKANALSFRPHPYPPVLPPLKTDPCAPGHCAVYLADHETYCKWVAAFLGEHP